MTKSLWFNGICCVCPRECVGFGWYDPAVWGRKGIGEGSNDRIYYCCSIECMNIVQRSKGKMSSPTPHEIDSMVDAGIRGGDYLDGLKKTDLATLSYDEWMTFVESVCVGYCDSMRKRAGAEMLIPNGSPPPTMGTGKNGKLL